MSDHVTQGETFIVFSFCVDTGMDDGKEDTDPALVQGAYLSFLHLRHLRLRDLHRTVCISDIAIVYI